MSERESRSGALTRREAVNLLGVGAGLGLLTALREQTGLASAIQGARAAQPTFPRGAVVRTILKDVSPERITGATLIHEHLSMGRPEWKSDRPTATFYDNVDLIADEVKACAKDGVSCIVDTGGRDLGRKIDALRTIATRSGMLIVACGGFHLKPDYPPDTFQKTEDQIADDFYALANAERWGAIGEMGIGTRFRWTPTNAKYCAPRPSSMLAPDCQSLPTHPTAVPGARWIRLTSSRRQV